MKKITTCLAIAVLAATYSSSAMAFNPYTHKCSIPNITALLNAERTPGTTVVVRADTRFSQVGYIRGMAVAYSLHGTLTTQSSSPRTVVVTSPISIDYSRDPLPMGSSPASEAMACYNALKTKSGGGCPYC